MGGFVGAIVLAADRFTGMVAADAR